MYYIEFTNRLGNNLFQFATALSLGLEFKIYSNNPIVLSNVKKYKDIFYSGVEVVTTLPDKIEEYLEKSYRYSKIPLVFDTDIVLRGYFQSHKYICRKKVLSQFNLASSCENYVKQNYNFIYNERFHSIHVRRGDYLNMLYKHPFCGMQYYNEAISLLGRHENYLIVSDDIDWCKANFKLPNVIFIENSNPLNDLYLQSLCVNNIISNSSFGWWGAYLNRNPSKIVVAPKMWFGFDWKDSVEDLLPEDYTVLANGYSISQLATAVFQRASVRFRR